MTTPGGSGPRLGILGAGTVGSALLRRLAVAPEFSLGPVLVRDPAAARDVPPNVAFTDDPAAVLDESEIVVELLGGTTLAFDLMIEALGRGKTVVTANKAALAERWDAFLPYLREGRVHFEAAVMAGTPAIGPLSGALRGSTPIELHAILNGTCSFILTRLEEGAGFAEALAEAQRLGYAEADPTLDVGGIDAAHKLALLGRLAFDPDLSWEEVRANTHGIDHLTPAVVREAMEDGGSVALVGSIVPAGGRWLPRVRPVYLPASHPLAAVNEQRGALLFESRELGEVLISGPGAGGDATASAVLADILAAAAGRPGPTPLPRPAPLPGARARKDLGELLRA